jgi:NAD(P)-dependent dehydrogenase (short-subunit alcohol dehydrogenase family)
MTTHDTALVTGANKGIGLQTTRRLLEEGWTVWLGARDATLGEQAVAALGAEEHPGTVRLLELDVTDDGSVARSVDTVAETGLDVLVNNAGISGGHRPAEETLPAHFLPVYGVNVLGPVRMTLAFLPLLRASAHPRIVNVSSGMGSFARTTDPDRLESTLVGIVYTSSKAALNMVTSQYAKARPGIKVNAVDPGYTGTDFNNHRGPQTVEQGAAPVVAAAMVGPDGPTGGFFGGDGVIGW